MSNITNEQLMDRAREVAEYWVGTPWQEAIDTAMQSNNMERLYKVVTDAGAEASRQEFYGNNVLERTDVY